nr:hypothetical protein [Tanacetum cinerariifolium]
LLAGNMVREMYRDEHLNTIPETESDGCPNPSESEDLSNIRSECNVPIGDDFTTCSNSLFDADENFSSSDDKSFLMRTFQRKFSNPLFDEQIISIKIDPHHFNAESDFIESLLNQDSSIISSPKIDSLLESSRGSNSVMEEIDIFLASDDSIPLGIKNGDYDSEGDILFLKEFLSNDSPSLPENESFHFDHYFDLSSPRPPAKLPDDDGIFFDDETDTGLLTAKVVGDILMPRLLPTQPTLCPVIDICFHFHPKMRIKFISYLIGDLKLFS